MAATVPDLEHAIIITQTKLTKRFREESKDNHMQQRLTFQDLARFCAILSVEDLHDNFFLASSSSHPSLLTNTTQKAVN